MKNSIAQDSGIDVGQGINLGPGKFGKKNKHRFFLHFPNKLSYDYLRFEGIFPFPSKLR
jgi:hypothetical protein